MRRLLDIMRPLAMLAALVFALCPLGAGAGGVGEAQGSFAARASDGPPDPSGEVARLDARRTSLVKRREALEARLDILSSEIVELKLRSSRRLRSEAELNRKLQESRELSVEIDRLAREQEEVTSRLVGAALDLADAYEELAAGARADLARIASSDEERDEDARAILERLAVLEAKRRAVLDGLSRLQREGEDIEQARPLLRERARTDDPEELRARADILRDTRDRLSRRLGELEREATVIRRRRELEREMDGFLAESRLFDETDRAAARLVAQDSSDRPVSGGRSPTIFTGGEDATLASPPQEEAGGGERHEDGEEGGEGIWMDGPTEEAPGGGYDSHPHVDSEPVAPGSGDETSLFQLDRITSRAEASAALDALLSHDAGESLEDIELHRREIERLIRRLERRADVLERRADAMEEQR